MDLLVKKHEQFRLFAVLRRPPPYHKSTIEAFLPYVLNRPYYKLRYDNLKSIQHAFINPICKVFTYLLPHLWPGSLPLIHQSASVAAPRKSGSALYTHQHLCCRRFIPLLSTQFPFLWENRCIAASMGHSILSPRLFSLLFVFALSSSSFNSAFGTIEVERENGRLCRFGWREWAARESIALEST